MFVRINTDSRHDLSSIELIPLSSGNLPAIFVINSKTHRFMPIRAAGERNTFMDVDRGGPPTWPGTVIMPLEGPRLQSDAAQSRVPCYHSRLRCQDRTPTAIFSSLFFPRFRGSPGDTEVGGGPEMWVTRFWRD